MSNIPDICLFYWIDTESCIGNELSIEAAEKIRSLRIWLFFWQCSICWAEGSMSIEDAIQNEIDTPAVLVDLDVAMANILRFQAYANAHGLRVQPHIKTHMSILALK